MSEKDDLQISWDWGTAYDLFVSLMVLHYPENFGLRGSWAAGVRSRIPPDERKVLEDAQLTLPEIPLHFVYSLPEPKDSATALWKLGALSPVERFYALVKCPEFPQEASAILTRVVDRGAWDEQDVSMLRETLYGEKKKKPKDKQIETTLKWWSRPAEFGERYLEALTAYREVFFAEEENRIRPALKAALQRGQLAAQEKDVPDLLEDLSQGVRFTALAENYDAQSLVLTPSYWSTPFIIHVKVSEGRMVLLYGARPAGASLVPGEEVPDDLLHALKALADPTRLRILKYLAEKPHSPADLSRRLRLRAPTVIHHLNALRLAGLVHLILGPEGERQYDIRSEMVRQTCVNLQNFLVQEPEKET